MSREVVSVGKLFVRLSDDGPPSGSIECGHVVCEVGYAAGYRFACELTKIREALIAARAVLADPDRPNDLATPAEVRLTQLLVDLEVTS